MKEGYLQNKIREQADRIEKLENEIQELKTAIKWSKKGYEDAKELMTKAVNIDSFKKHILNYLERDIKNNIKEQYHFLYKNNQKSIDFLMETSLKKIREILDKEVDELYSTLVGLSLLLAEKGILLEQDVERINEFSKEYTKGKSVEIMRNLQKRFQKKELRKYVQNISRN